MATTRGRLVAANQVVYDQADFFQIDGFTRITGLVPANLTCQVFFNNALQSWPMVSGATVTDPQVVAGKVYWQEVGVSTGIYNVRFRPNAVGYWRLLITYPAGSQILAQDFDVTTAGINGTSGDGTGLITNFIKPGDKP